MYCPALDTTDRYPPRITGHKRTIETATTECSLDRMDEKNREWLGVSELAEWLGVVPQTIYYMNSDGSGPRRYRIGKLIKFRRSDVESWLAEQAIEPGQPAFAPK